jgi:hypothetical protein
MRDPMPRAIPTAPRWLGLAGLLPPAGCVAVALALPAFQPAAALVGGLYAAMILSFLGGLWWMDSLERRVGAVAPYVLAVAPSLVAWAALLAWLLGGAPPASSLVALGAAVLVSPLADRAATAAVHDLPGWWALRLTLSAGLGSLTLLLALLAR